MSLVNAKFNIIIYYSIKIIPIYISVNLIASTILFLVILI